MSSPVHRYRPYRVSVFVVVIGVMATWFAFSQAASAVRHSDQLLLSEDATQGSLVLGSYIGAIPTGVANLGKIVTSSGVDAVVWEAAARTVATDSGYSGLALLREAGGRFSVVASVGTIERPVSGSGDTAMAAALADKRSVFAVATSAGDHRWMSQIIGPPTTPAGYALYSETPAIATPISLASLPGHPFQGIEGAVYIGSETPDNLFLTTTTRMPFTGQRAVAVLSGQAGMSSSHAVLSSHVGSVSSPGSLIMVVRATGHLSGASTARLPWLLLIVGFVSTLLVASLLELSERRRHRTAVVAEELKMRNADLDRAVESQQRTDARFAAMIRSSSDLTTVTSSVGEIVYQSPASAELLGISHEELISTSFPARLHPDDGPLWHRTLAHAKELAGSGVTVEWRLLNSDGVYVPVESQLTNLLDDPAVAGFVLNSRDVSDRKRLEEELRHQAFHDSLTGLANRALFQDRLVHALARLTRADGVLAVLFLDIDDFKAVNDGWGHGAGDALLQAVAQRLISTVRVGDTLARLGGDEFAVLLEGTDVLGAQQTAQRILDVLQPAVSIGGIETDVRASIGLVTTSNGYADASEVLRDADIAMYSAKSAGKARVETFHPGLHGLIINRLQLETDLRRALDNEELDVHYQEIVYLDSGEVAGIEALMRWNHPQRGLVMPADFIPIAESSGLIVPMGRWLLRRACRDARALQDRTERYDLHLAVNLSARQLDDPDLVSDVEFALSESGLFAGQLTLEITESVVMTDPEQSLDVLKRLKALGLRLSIDDFGTGYSSLAYLQRLPVDEIKIDRCFIAASGDSETESDALVKSMVRLARDFGLGTVAEGIETEAQMHRLRDAGCRLAQGYLFARPVGVGELREVMPHRSADETHWTGRAAGSVGVGAVSDRAR